MDADSAQGVIDAIHQAMAKRTCILIAQRVLMARGSDQVAVMDQGRIVETGTNEELMVRPGSQYRSIFAKQYGEQRLPPEQEP